MGAQASSPSVNLHTASNSVDDTKDNTGEPFCLIEYRSPSSQIHPLQGATAGAYTALIDLFALCKEAQRSLYFIQSTHALEVPPPLSSAIYSHRIDLQHLITHAELKFHASLDPPSSVFPQNNAVKDLHQLSKQAEIYARDQKAKDIANARKLKADKADGRYYSVFCESGWEARQDDYTSVEARLYKLLGGEYVDKLSTSNQHGKSSTGHDFSPDVDNIVPDDAEHPPSSHTTNHAATSSSDIPASSYRASPRPSPLLAAPWFLRFLASGDPRCLAPPLARMQRECAARQLPLEDALHHVRFTDPEYENPEKLQESGKAVGGALELLINGVFHVTIGNTTSSRAQITLPFDVELFLFLIALSFCNPTRTTKLRGVSSLSASVTAATQRLASTAPPDAVPRDAVDARQRMVAREDTMSSEGPLRPHEVRKCVSVNAARVVKALEQVWNGTYVNLSNPMPGSGVLPPAPTSASILPKSDAQSLTREADIGSAPAASSSTASNTQPSSLSLKKPLGPRTAPSFEVRVGGANTDISSLQRRQAEQARQRAAVVAAAVDALSNRSVGRGGVSTNAGKLDKAVKVGEKDVGKKHVKNDSESDDSDLWYSSSATTSEDEHFERTSKASVLNKNNMNKTNTGTGPLGSRLRKTALSSINSDSDSDGSASDREPIVSVLGAAQLGDIVLRNRRADDDDDDFDEDDDTDDEDDDSLMFSEGDYESGAEDDDDEPTTRVLERDSSDDEDEQQRQRSREAEQPRFQDVVVDGMLVKHVSQETAKDMQRMRARMNKLGISTIPKPFSGDAAFESYYRQNFNAALSGLKSLLADMHRDKQAAAAKKKSSHVAKDDPHHRSQLKGPASGPFSASLDSEGEDAGDDDEELDPRAMLRRAALMAKAATRPTKAVKPATKPVALPSSAAQSHAPDAADSRPRVNMRSRPTTATATTTAADGKPALNPHSLKGLQAAMRAGKEGSIAASAPALDGGNSPGRPVSPVSPSVDTDPNDDADDADTIDADADSEAGLLVSVEVEVAAGDRNLTLAAALVLDDEQGTADDVIDAAVGAASGEDHMEAVSVAASTDGDAKPQASHGAEAALSPAKRSRAAALQLRLSRAVPITLSPQPLPATLSSQLNCRQGSGMERIPLPVNIVARHIRQPAPQRPLQTSTASTSDSAARTTVRDDRASFLRSRATLLSAAPAAQTLGNAATLSSPSPASALTAASASLPNGPRTASFLSTAPLTTPTPVPLYTATPLPCGGAPALAVSLYYAVPANALPQQRAAAAAAATAAAPGESNESALLTQSLIASRTPLYRAFIPLQRGPAIPSNGQAGSLSIADTALVASSATVSSPPIEWRAPLGMSLAVAQTHLTTATLRRVTLPLALPASVCDGDALGAACEQFLVRQVLRAVDAGAKTREHVLSVLEQLLGMTYATGLCVLVTVKQRQRGAILSVHRVPVTLTLELDG